MFFPTNPDLADILGNTDFDFENLYLFLIFLVPKFPDFQVPDFQISKNLALGRAGLGPLHSYRDHSVQALASMV